MKTTRAILCAMTLLLAGQTRPAPAQNAAKQPLPALAERIQAITSRPEFRHASFGIELYDLDKGKPVYSVDADKLFTPASTTKLLTEGAMLELLGADHRFHTRVYRAGPIEAGGALKGDLVLVASGDPNLSGRIQPDGTLAFENEDHTYNGKAVAGDPLLVIRELAAQVAAHGVKRITGRVRVDASLFPEGEAELGTGEIVSPITVNDNAIDVTFSPGVAAGAPASMTVSPQTAYARFVNRVTTAAADSKQEVKIEKDVANPDGSHAVTVTGSMPLSKPSSLFAYPVPKPTRFAEVVLAEALREKGIKVEPELDAGAEREPKVGAAPPADFKALAVNYKPENLLAEHISPPLSEELKVTLKVSQNLHASMTPFILGAVLAHKGKDSAQAGFDLEHEFLEKAGLDLSGASQGDGAGGSEAAFFTPDFMVHYLAYMARQKDFPVFYNALPILGRDGTLWNIQTQSPAAGFVHAKTGTYDAYDALNHNLMVTGKGLAGYFTTPQGRHLVFAIYANRVAVPMEEDAATKIVGQALGEIAAAAYLALSQSNASGGGD